MAQPAFQTIPCLVDALTGVPLVEISAGGYHSMTLSISGAVIGWGKNELGTCLSLYLYTSLQYL